MSTHKRVTESHLHTMNLLDRCSGVEPGWKGGCRGVGLNKLAGRTGAATGTGGPASGALLDTVDSG